MRSGALLRGFAARRGWLFVLLALLPLMVPLRAAAQVGAVRGALLDAATGQPVPFATIVLLRAVDSTVVTGTQTAEDGLFTLEHLGLGAYVLRATVVGYRTGRKAVTLTAAAPIVQLGTLRLRSVATELSDVVIRGERAVVQAGLDKRVVNVAKDLTAVGGTAADVLQNVPSVTVDQSGAVSLRGSSAVTIFIDGKPSGAAGGGRGTSLSQIPASQIETIEVITNPSARYDAEGAAGIINIVLKKNRQDGLNGTATAGIGTREKYTGALSLNYHRGKVNVFGTYDGRQERRFSNGSLDQKTQGFASVNGANGPTEEAQTLTLRQNRTGASTTGSHAVRLGVDYAFSPEQTLTLSVQPRLNTGRGWENIASRQTRLLGGLTTQDSVGTTDRANRTGSDNRSADITLDYRRTWTDQKGRELTASAIFTPLRGKTTLDSRLTYLDGGATPQQQQTTDNQLRQGAAQADYVQPLGGGRRLEAGAKSVWRHYDNDYRYVSSTPLRFDPSNRFQYQEYIQAAYATFGSGPGRWRYQAGVRAEQTNTHGRQLATGQTFRRSYLNLFPSAVLVYEPSEAHQTRLSYSRRVQRPDQGELNPFTDRSDPLNLNAGNPALLPEYIHAVELGHQLAGGKRTLTITAFWNIETQTIKPFRRVITDPLTGNQVTSTTRVNFGNEINYGLEVVGTTPLTSWWKLTGTGSAFRRVVQGTGANTDITNTSFTYTARVTSTFTPTKRLDGQVAFNYRSPVASSQGRRLTQYNTDVAVKYTILHERGSVAVRVSDVFNTLRFNYTSYGPAFTAEGRNKRESRIGYLTFSYLFGRTGPDALTPRRKPQQGPTDAGGGGGFE